MGMMDNNEFYIGWQPKASAANARFIRGVIVILLLIMLVVAILLAVQQRKFSTGQFEFGRLTEVKGLYQRLPVPAVKVMTSKDAVGNSGFITIPLVGYGKSGAEGVIAELEKQSGTSFDQKEVVFRGTLIYNDGKTLLQIDRHDHPMVRVAAAKTPIPVIQKQLGTVELTGEILDPKCYFGVMKPGQGKPHKDCAVRCIEGGISPVFWVRNDIGESMYYLLLDEQGKKMNTELKDYVADPVSLTANAVQYDDWILLYVKKGSIRRTGGFSFFKSQNVSCNPPANK
jgi:hypothetical protein